MIELDGNTSLWIIGLLSFLLGTLIGCILTYSIVARNNRTHQLQVELNELSEDFRNYRDQVAHHFMRTSELVQEMTQSYRSVYEHLASGAQHLCGDSDTPILQQPVGGRPADDPQVTAGEDDYDELEELSRIRNDIDELLGETARSAGLETDNGGKSVQH